MSLAASSHCNCPKCISKRQINKLKVSANVPAQVLEEEEREQTIERDDTEPKMTALEFETIRNSLFLARQRLNAILRKENLESVEMPGDGNCQFRAIAAFFSGGIDHIFIRRKIVEYIYNHQAAFFADIVVGLGYRSVEQYCREMIQPGTWGDAITLMAYCLMQNVNIVVFSDQGKSELYPNTAEEQKSVNFKERQRMGLVRLNNHYEATRLI